MVYVDTSALVALIVHEPHSAAVAAWYARTKGELVSAVWCVTEFASALAIKQRTGQLDPPQAESAWEHFSRLAANDVRLLPLEATHFHLAATMTLNAAPPLRAGDALHLACAEHAGATSIVTLDEVMARNALRLKIKPVPLT
jgi:predicted nucleic acid-binding protein